MDLFSHACLGALLGEIVTGSGAVDRLTHRRIVVWAAVMGAAPGTLQLLWRAAGVPQFVLPTQSFVVGLAVVLPICRAFALPRSAAAAWFLALAVDLLSGHGSGLITVHGAAESSAIGALWPMPWRTAGLLRSETWSIAGMLGSALACAFAWWRVRTILGRRRRLA